MTLKLPYQVHQQRNFHKVRETARSASLKQNSDDNDVDEEDDNFQYVEFNDEKIWKRTEVLW